MSHVTKGALLGFLLKAAWGSIIVSFLATADPFWHQIILVLGGATITAISVIIAAVISVRSVRRPMERVAEEVEQHRTKVERRTDSDTPQNRRENDEPTH